MTGPVTGLAFPVTGLAFLGPAYAFLSGTRTGLRELPWHVSLAERGPSLPASGLPEADQKVLSHHLQQRSCGTYAHSKLSTPRSLLRSDRSLGARGVCRSSAAPYRACYNR